MAKNYDSGELFASSKTFWKNYTSMIAAACVLFACTICGDPASGIRVLFVAALISSFWLPPLSE